MPATSPIPQSPFGRTFVAASAVLGLVACWQLGTVVWAFATKGRQQVATAENGGARRPPQHIDVNKLVAEVPPPEEPLSVSGDPIGSSLPDTLPEEPLRPPVAVPERSTIPPVAIAAPPSMPMRPTPVPLTAFTPKVDPRYTELVEQGKLLRGNGDTAGALSKFREASALDPENPLTIAETAFTYEKMSLPDKAAEQWRRILAMGERAGVYYSAARSKFETAMMNTVRETTPTPTPTLAPIPQGKSLGLGALQITPDNDPASAKKFMLRVPIRARQGSEVDVSQMKVFVLFYDRINGKDIVRTTANVSTAWGSPPADWAEGDTETLEVTYDLARTPGEPREYNGYIVRLYYGGDLQDIAAEPASLNQKFPAPAQISE